MWKCPVCDLENETLLCTGCGFDGSRDYLQYPSFAPVKERPFSAAAQRAARAGEAIPCSRCGGNLFRILASRRTACCSRCGAELSPEVYVLPEDKQDEPAPSKPRCAKCGAEVDGAFCGMCGAKYVAPDEDKTPPKTCRKCGAEVDGAFCGMCGTRYPR